MLAKISVFPIDKGESVGNYVAKVIDYIIRESDKAGVRYEITSMGTLIEGETEDVWRLLKGSHEVMRKYSNRVYITIEIDDRRGKTDAITYKKKKIEQILKEKKK